MIKSLEKISHEDIFSAFRQAFIDYDFQLSKEELRALLIRRSFDPALSFGVFEEGELKSFILNGIGIFNGEITAYDTGTGTIKEFRGLGLASKLFIYSQPILRKAGITRYLLEVLQHNLNAISLYKKLGFEVSREFNYYSQDVSSLKLPDKTLPPWYRLQEISLTQLIEIGNLGDFTPSWQNNLQAISRRADDFKMVGALLGLEIVGYCVFEPSTGDITQIAVKKSHRRQGIGTSMLKEVLEYNTFPSVKAVNCEVSCNNITRFLNYFGIPVKGKQFEMTKKL